MAFQTWAETSSLQTLIDYAGGTSPVYIGIAQPGQLTSTPAWQIKKVTYDGNGNPTEVQFAQGTTEFLSVWDDRTTYQYS